MATSKSNSQSTYNLAITSIKLPVLSSCPDHHPNACMGNNPPLPPMPANYLVNLPQGNILIRTTETNDLKGKLMLLFLDAFKVETTLLTNNLTISEVEITPLRQLTVKEAALIAYTIQEHYRSFRYGYSNFEVEVFGNNRVVTINRPGDYKIELMVLLMNDDNCFENAEAKELALKKQLQAEADKLNGPKRPSIVEEIELF